MLIRNSSFNKFGGYQPWKCAADTEFKVRLKNILRQNTLKNNLFKRRIHKNSLTNNNETDMKSEMRKKYHSQIKTANSADGAKIKCTTSMFTVINQNKKKDVEIKHLIITRFMSEQFGKTDDELFEDSFLKNSFDLLKDHLLKTLSNQTNKNFELVILIHDRIPDDKLSFIYDIQFLYDFPITIIRRSELENFVQSFKNGYDFIITSRIDYDDHIYKDVVETTQQRVDEKYSIQLYGLNNGVSIINGETEAHFMSMDYGKSGYFSVFETLIINTKKIQTPFTIYKLGNHAMVCKTLKKDYKNFGVSELSEIKIERDNTNEIRYIWLRHKNSQTAKTRGEYHRTKQIVNNLELNDFGYAATKE